MKRLIVIIGLLIIMGCKSIGNDEGFLNQRKIELEEEVTRLENKPVEKVVIDKSDEHDLENRIIKLEDEIALHNLFFDTIRSTKNIEITDDSIYVLHDGFNDEPNSISEVIYVESGNGSIIAREDFSYMCNKIETFKVSKDNKWIAVLVHDEDQKLVFMSHDGEIIMEISYNAFIDTLIADYDLRNQSFKLLGFSTEGSVFWGGIGGDLDITISFLYNIDDEKFVVFDGNNWDEIEKYRTEYPLFQ